MNKSELVIAIAQKANVTQKQADAILTAATEEIMAALSSGDDVKLVGFGTFEVRERSERQGRNPQNGEVITIPATKVPAFAPGKAFKDRVAPGQEDAAAA
jgi:DNA-binding protein HU-beta